MGRSVWMFPPTLGGETELLSPPIQIGISPTPSRTNTHKEGEYLPDNWLPVIQLNCHITLTPATSFGIPNDSEPQRFCLSHRIKYFKPGKTLATRMLGGEERLMWQTDLALNSSGPDSLPLTGLTPQDCFGSWMLPLTDLMIHKCGRHGSTASGLQNRQLILRHHPVVVWHRSVLGSYHKPFPHCPGLPRPPANLGLSQAELALS